MLLLLRMYSLTFFLVGAICSFPTTSRVDRQRHLFSRLFHQHLALCLGYLPGLDPLLVHYCQSITPYTLNQELRAYYTYQNSSQFGKPANCPLATLSAWRPAPCFHVALIMRRQTTGQKREPPSNKRRSSSITELLAKQV